MDMDKLLTKAQQRAAKEQFKKEVSAALTNEIIQEAQKIARRFVKENKKEIEKAAAAQFKVGLDKHLQKIVSDALRHTHLYIDA